MGKHLKVKQISRCRKLKTLSCITFSYYSGTKEELRGEERKYFLEILCGNMKTNLMHNDLKLQFVNISTEVAYGKPHLIGKEN